MVVAKKQPPIAADYFRQNMPAEMLEMFRTMGRTGGKKSAAGRMTKMTPEQRSEVARKAAAASAKVRSEKAAERKAK